MLKASKEPHEPPIEPRTGKGVLLGIGTETPGTSFDLLTAKLWTTYLLAKVAGDKPFTDLVTLADVKVMIDLRTQAVLIVNEIRRELQG